MAWLASAALPLAPLATSQAVAGERPAAILVSESPAFDTACVRYYRQGLDAEVQAAIAPQFCDCLAAEVADQGLGPEVLAFLARTYGEDLTAFIGEYPDGEMWMEAYFAAERSCKSSADFGSDRPPQSTPAGRIEAASWGGIVRSGPGKEFSTVARLEEGEHVVLIENTGVFWKDYPWWKIEVAGRREGYQWGGILCSLGERMEGIYETCP